MKRIAFFSDYPLPEALTHRVVTYLNLFRLLISLILLFALFSGLTATPLSMNKSVIAGTALLSYFVMAAFLIYESRQRTTTTFFLALASLLIDIVFLSTLLFIFGKLESGIAILLIFASASAGIVLPMRVALFYASLVVLAFIGEAVVGLLVRDESLAELVRAAIYGATTFTTAILVNLLSRWLKDYRLVAEKQAAQLTRLEQINELVIRRMRSGVLAVDADGVIQLMNESAWFLLGRPRAREKILSSISPQLNKALETWQDDHSPDIEPMSLRGSQARVIPKFVALPGSTSIRNLIFLEDNEVVSQRSLEMSAHMMANLSGSIAHEIRNPLGAISHAAQLLNESEEIVDSDLRLVDIIHSQSGRMNGIVQNILQLSRHEKSRPDIFELTPFLEDLAEETKKSLPGIRLTVDIDASKSQDLILFDRSQLHQALWKLLENALRHAHLDAAIPQVIMTKKDLPGTGYCIITVEDNGPGIPEANMERIFQPFYTTHKEGSGLGLYIARQLCEVNQAELTVDSILGSCSRFHIRLALAESRKAKLLKQLNAKAKKA
jgi:two-component system sensor histidine kinase PilS (NtrC family)